MTINELGSTDIPWAALAPVIGLSLLLTVLALIDCLRSERVNGPKWAWVLAILFLNVLGPVAYFIFGRKGRD